MGHWHNPLKIASSLLIALGLLIGVAAVVGAISTPQTASPFNPMDVSGQSNIGFVPIIAPQVLTLEPLNATTSPSPTNEPNGIQPPVSPVTTPIPLLIPDRVVIPAIQLDAPVVQATFKIIEYQGKSFQQWVPPSIFAAGLLATSAPLGIPGNTVLIGHHNEFGEVFGHLVDLHVFDLIQVYSGNLEFDYIIILKTILPERDQPVEVRLRNAQWIAPSPDQRLTLVTCWPYNNNTHRLVIVAIPANQFAINNYKIIPRLTPHSP